jgi:hypothetical protein
VLPVPLDSTIEWESSNAFGKAKGQRSVSLA